VRVEGAPAHAALFMPGYPDGSFGWARVHAHLPPADAMPRVFFDYVGMGDSDKPEAHAYSTAERADLVEALLRQLAIESVLLVAFDFSSLVVLELLQRRLERAADGRPDSGPSIRGVFVFNGGLFTDGHTHPWYTTPVLRRLPPRARGRMGGSMWLFKRMTRVMWSRGYPVSDAEVRALHAALDRHDGLFYLAAAAGFVVDHQAEGSRLDFGRLFEAWRARIPFLVGGSSEDPFEHRQVGLAAQRLGARGLRIERLPGGHLTTSEHPRALAGLIAGFAAHAA